MKKLFYTLTLLLTASLLFTSCKNDDDNYPPGIGNPTPTTDPGVLIGYIYGEPIRWATRNVNTPGTFAAYPHSAGRLFQWGTLNGVTHHLDNTTSGAIDDWYNQTTAENRVAWTPANDPCPTGWRVPTQAELTALHAAGVGDWTKLSGVNGRWFGTATNRIFLPAAGWRSWNTGALGSVGFSGFYWGNAQNDSSSALRLWFGSGFSNVGSGSRSSGFSVRCVVK